MTVIDGPASASFGMITGSEAPSVVDCCVDGSLVLVVEDEPLIALDIREGLTDAGAVVIGPASTVR